MQDTALDGVGHESGAMVRAAARAGWDGLTLGRARGFVQVNLFVLPEAVADEFAAFCAANPHSCPLVARGRAGDPTLPMLGSGIDVRTDVPSYLSHVPGERAHRLPDLKRNWQADLVPFAVGCWFGAEAALLNAGIRVRDAELGVQGALFRSDRKAVTVGRFAGPLVVSMRPFRIADIPRVIDITARLPRCHGAPLHRGDPAVLGIEAPCNPDWGEPMPLEPGEDWLYWGCGLTALTALEAAGVPFASHAPGAMLVTDLTEECL
ncbi:uncharacterized protein YcsI (UPF0317 family) [Humitalea rosea]|uniref:Uncharacterized protein YcsI (UPF0317 family) n=1 Tax=Humitalea rosea TaxID=990373 RepID=A0A2W7JFZ3_9PROT|nr:DUF1445 domain-containing protein [Humitalea rosea]PZW50993.1 uncharacterized protein YcsI (UPF0317 family) [Humitalea rosea]